MIKLALDKSSSPKLNSQNFNSELHIVVVEKSEITNKKTASKIKSDLKADQGFTYQHYSANSKVEERFNKANFLANNGQVYIFDGLDSAQPIAFIGYEEKPGSYAFPETLRRLGSLVFSLAKKYNAENITVALGKLSLKSSDSFSAFMEGIELTDYTFDRYTSKANQPSEPSNKNEIVNLLSKKFTGIKSLTFISKEQLPLQSYEQTRYLTNAIKQTRDLINMPAKDCTPAHMVKVAREIARESKLGIKVYDKDDLQKMGANLILAVADGSDEPPYLITLTYKPKKPSSKVIALVGKGVTFDSGGLCIKPGGSMETMKDDMSGAAAVIAAMKVLAKLQPSVEVRAYIPTTENMINGKAMRPGDVIKTMSGKHVEIINTDAEGRMILADAVYLAEKEGATTIIDIATLTGAIIAALGTHYAGLFTDNDKLAEQLINAGEKSGERYWRMPLIEEHKEYMKSKVADIKHIASGSKGAGATNGALFVKYFIKKAAYAHLDIAGTAFADGDKHYIKAGGVGFGVGTLVRYVMGLK